MLLILIPAAWLALVAFFVILAQMASQADEALPAIATPHNGARGLARGLTRWEDHPSPPVHGRRMADGAGELVLGRAMRETRRTRRVGERRPSCGS